ncbi:hypothetical protein BDV95DRAFT_580814 [Massariosphaeria phaeospora]|uniref:F-box domain-containing protein n=1 Tax=Massariosphaeria phaeospora TaxID=100035 RepID=A0A7C8I0Z9_9PLEO|nr:hypothetical protein BDV95DRAFT_580814 [Massariosphaeria phaeospora]
MSCVDSNNSGSSRPETPNRPSEPILPASSPPKPPSSKSTPSKFRKPRTQTQQRRAFLEHLKLWSSDHDSSPYFYGGLSLMSTISEEKFELGKSVKCLLVGPCSMTSQKVITIRLFPPRRTQRKPRYRMLVRYGASWVTAREFFNKEYFAYEKAHSYQLRLKNTEKDAVSIQPLFHQFLDLPLELQQMILGTAVNTGSTYWPASIARRRPRAKGHTHTPDLPLATIFKISKAMSEHLTPWIFHTTSFCFETTALTSFLWQAGPLRRPEIKRITLKFGKLAPPHCIRWFSPDLLFELFDFAVHTTPKGLQYLWRCQLQELARELHLSILKIDVDEIIQQDVPFVLRILRQAFGSVERVKIVGCDEQLARNYVHDSEHKTWRELCDQWFKGPRRSRPYFNPQRASDLTELKSVMDDEQEFFDRTASQDAVPYVCRAIQHG